MRNEENGRRPDSYLDNYRDLDDIFYKDTYENSIPAKLNTHFDKFVRIIGGKGRAILSLFGLMAVILSAMAYLSYMGQWRQQFSFDGSTFRLESVDRVSARNMRLRDQHGNILNFTAIPSSSQISTLYSVSYFNSTFSVEVSPFRRDYTFSDGSHGNNLMGQGLNAAITHQFPVGRVPHFNNVQQAESVALAMFIDFYQGYTRGYVYVFVLIVIVLGSLALWLILLMCSFYREGLHEVTRPFQRVWEAELEDRRLARLDGKVSVVVLIVEFAAVLIIAIVLMRMI